MMWKKSTFFLITLTLSNFSNAAYFKPTEEKVLQRSDAQLLVQAKQANYLNVDIEGLRQELLENDEADIELPLPDGSTAIYHFELSPIAAQELLDKYPQIRTFFGADITDPTNTGRFSITPLGFRGLFRHNGESVFIDPQYKNSSRYISYRGADAVPLGSRPEDVVLKPDFLERYENSARTAAKDGGSDGNLRTYRLAVAATGEFSQFFSNDTDPPATIKANGLAGIVDAINRINEVFGRDFNVALQLIGNNDEIVYANPATDPYQNITGTTDLDRNQSNLDSLGVIGGPANYDIGHLLTTEFGGVAFLGSVCYETMKAKGMSGYDTPNSDAFYIRVLAHELGHQFGANHSFNGTTLSCGFGNRNATTAFEPGSGSTIMSYAGICDSEDLQDTADPYFHAGSVAEVNRFITTGLVSIDGTLYLNDSVVACPSITVPVNNLPDVDAGSDYTIPANTPIYLAGSGSDVDVDLLTYTWEQMDVGTATASTDEWVDDGTRTISRTFEPSVSGNNRFIPNIGVYIDRADTDVYPNGESLPTTNRTLNFRLTVRDDNGGTAYEDKVLTVTTAAGPFDLLTPEVNDIWTQGTTVVTWDVANTDAAPVSCSQVNIYYNGDIVDGTDDYTPDSFNTVLALGEDNDGEAYVTAPAVASFHGRVLITCADGAFYTMSEEAFEVSSSSSVIVSSVSNESVEEGGELIFNVAMSAVPSSDEIVNFSITPETASPSDIGTVSLSAEIIDNGDGTITVPTGIASFTVSVRTTEDRADEIDETFSVIVGSASGTGTIVDDDEGSGPSECTSGTYGDPYSSYCRSDSGGGSSGFTILMLLGLLTAYKLQKQLSRQS